MSGMLYKLVGFVTWKALKLYLSQKLPSRPVLVGGTAAALVVAVLAAAGVAKRDALTD